MAHLATPGIFTQTASVALLLAGLWRRDCVLLASAPIVAQRSFLLHMEWGSPWCPLRAATRAITAGVLGLVAALALVIHVLGVQLGWWWAIREQDAWAPAWILAAALLLVLLQRTPALMVGEAQFWLAMLAGAWAATWPWQQPLLGAACAFALVIAVVVMWSAWGFARHCGSGLLRQAD